MHIASEGKAVREYAGVATAVLMLCRTSGEKTAHFKRVRVAFRVCQTVSLSAALLKMIFVHVARS